MHLVNATSNLDIENWPFVLSMNPFSLIVYPLRISFFYNYKCRIPDCFGPRHFQHSEVAVPYYAKLETILKGSLKFKLN